MRPTTLPGDDDPRRVAHAQHRAGHGVFGSSRSCRQWRAGLTAASIRSCRANIAIPRRCPAVEWSWSAHRRPEFSWPTRFGPAAARSCCPPGSTLRVPRRYRGRDIMWWLDRAGILDETEESVYDVEISRQAPSFQLVGRPDHATLNLERLRRAGVLVVGHLSAIDGHRLRFDDDLVKTTAAADAKLASLLSRLDRVADSTGLGGLVDEPEPFEPLWPRVRQRADGPSPEGGRHRQRDLGNRLPPHVLLAEDAAARCAGRAAPSGRRHTLRWCLRDRTAVPTDAQVGLHRRRRCGRARAGGAHCGQTRATAPKLDHDSIHDSVVAV